MVVCGLSMSHLGPTSRWSRLTSQGTTWKKFRHQEIKSRLMDWLPRGEDELGTDAWWKISVGMKTTGERSGPSPSRSLMRACQHSDPAWLQWLTFPTSSLSTGRLSHQGKRQSTVLAATLVLCSIWSSAGKDVMAKASKEEEKKVWRALCLRAGKDGTTHATSKVHNAVHLLPRHVSLGDSWFTPPWTGGEMALCGHHHTRVVNADHSQSPKILTLKMQNLPFGSHLLLQTIAAEEIEFCDLGPKCNSNTPK